MRALVREGLAGGAVGLSTGLEYTPGSFATAGRAGRAGRRSCAARSTPTRPICATKTTGFWPRSRRRCTWGRLAGVAVQVSHLKAQGERNHWKAEAAFAAIEAARAAGVDAHFDRYPYVAYATGLSNLFPASARAGGTARFLARLADPETGPGAGAGVPRQDRAAGLLGRGADQPDRRPQRGYARGRRLGELAAELGEDPYDLTVRLLRDAGGSVGMIGFGMSEENTERMLAHPLGMVCSDGGAYAPYGPLSRSSPHPRGYGSFSPPRVLGHYVRERRAMPLETAIHKMSGLPARKLGLGDRGVLQRGRRAADAVVFDPDRVGRRGQPSTIPTSTRRG